MKPIVVVQWDDATMSDASHWQDGEFPSPPVEHLSVSVGFLTHKTKDYLVLLQTTSPEQHANPITLLRSSVRRMYQLWPVPALAKSPEG